MRRMLAALLGTGLALILLAGCAPAGLWRYPRPASVEEPESQPELLTVVLPQEADQILQDAMELLVAKAKDISGGQLLVQVTLAEDPLALYREGAAEAVVLTDTRHNNEIAALAGRNVVCGSPSYLYYHGLPYDRAQRDVGQMYAAPQESQALLAQYQVRYILVSDFERGSYPVNQAALDALYPRVYDDGSRVLYQVTEQEDIP